jgi:hypothetical protein
LIIHDAFQTRDKGYQIPACSYDLQDEIKQTGGNQKIDHDHSYIYRQVRISQIIKKEKFSGIKEMNKQQQ